jgi:uncharacterized protein YbaR (Trm112 family)
MIEASSTLALAITGPLRELHAMQAEILSMLRCPQDGTPLELAPDALVDELNEAIRADRLVDRAGRQIAQTIDRGLVRKAGDVLYPIIDQIPVLLVDESIELAQLGRTLSKG